jgi:hypothetical protein
VVSAAEDDLQFQPPGNRDFYGLFWFYIEKSRVKCGDFAVFPQAAVLR